VSPAQERVEELAALCAAGAATASERSELESMAAEDPGVREVMRGYADAASFLALDLVPLAPPAGALAAVKRRVVPGARGGGGGGIPVVPPPTGRAPGAGDDVISLASRRRGPVVVAVVLPLAAAAAFAFFWLQERDRGSDLRRRAASLESDKEAAQAIAADLEKKVGELQTRLAASERQIETVTTPELKLATMKNEQGLVVKYLIDPLTGSWYVIAFKLPTVEADKDYQLWFLDKKQGGKPIPSDVLKPGMTGTLQTITRVPPGVEPLGAAISLEKQGGSTTGTPDKVIIGGELL
jgi:anti-sigma-K factor RskA